MNFDIRGNLKPYEKIELTLESFKAYFVDEFEGISERRQEIFEQYAEYLREFEEEVSDTFTQWIDGTFVTNKRTPRDIDFVTLLDYETYQEKEKLIEEKYRGQNAKLRFGRIDAYFVKVYPKDHRRAFVSEYDLVYWNNWFTETKKNRAKKKFKKGFVEIKFGSKSK